MGEPILEGISSHVDALVNHHNTCVENVVRSIETVKHHILKYDKDFNDTVTLLKRKLESLSNPPPKRRLESPEDPPSKRRLESPEDPPSKRRLESPKDPPSKRQSDSVAETSNISESVTQTGETFEQPRNYTRLTKQGFCNVFL